MAEKTSVARPLIEPVRRLLGPVRIGIQAVQQIEGTVREIAGLFVGAAIARGADRQVEGFGNARVLRMCLREGERLSAQPVGSCGDRLQLLPFGGGLVAIGGGEEGRAGGGSLKQDRVVGEVDGAKSTTSCR